MASHFFFKIRHRGAVILKLHVLVFFAKALSLCLLSLSAMLEPRINWATHGLQLVAPRKQQKKAEAATDKKWCKS